jgi:hypothetical protein
MARENLVGMCRNARKWKGGVMDSSAKYESIEGLTRVLAGMLIAASAVAVLAVVSSGIQLGLLRGEHVAGIVTAGLYRENSIGALGLVLTAATLPVFGVWILRAHRNLPGLGAKDLDVSPGWALGWFFVPFANLWMPYRAMRTLWRASHDAARWQLQAVPWWVTLWWVAWLARQVLGTSMAMRGPSASAIQAQLQWTELNITVQTVGLLLNGLAAMLVLRISRAQSARVRSSKRAEPRETAGPASRPGMA